MMHRDDIDGDDLSSAFAPPPPDKLYAHHRWQLSAMLDGELSPDEAKFMLRRLQHDSALAACWERWQVGGDILRGRGHALLPADFSRRVARKIAQDDGGEAVPEAQPASHARRGHWGGRAALAASVAVAALFVARQLPGDGVPAALDAPFDAVATAPASLPAEPVSEPGQRAASPATAASTLAAAAAAADRRARAQTQATKVQEVPRGGSQPGVALQPPAIVSAGLPLPQAAEFQPALALQRSDPADPFAAQSLVPPRPWPRASLPALAPAGTFSARYGDEASRWSFAPFEPRLQPRETASAAEEGIRLPVVGNDEARPPDVSEEEP